MLYSIEETTLAELAGVIRYKAGGDAALSPAGMAEAVDSLYGKNEVYYTTFYGADTNTLTLPLPWKPSTLCVLSQDAAGWSTPLTWMNLTMDMDAVGTKSALMQLADANLASKVATLATLSDYVQYADGILTFTPPQSTYWAASLWRSTVQYTVFAKKGEPV